jgi:hypothetical protein
VKFESFAAYVFCQWTFDSIDDRVLTSPINLGGKVDGADLTPTKQQLVGG